MKKSTIAAYCKKLRLRANFAYNTIDIEKDDNREYLLRLLEQEIKYRENTRKDKLLKGAGFYSLKRFNDFKFDEVTLPEAVTPEYLKNPKFLKIKQAL